MTVTNRYNKKDYYVVELGEKEVTLRRLDGTEFTISRAEFNFYYRENN